MNRGGKDGFTILEVIFFIAISSFLLVIALATIGTRQRGVQFTDAMRSLQSFVESQHSAALSGVNDNPVECSSSGGDSENCVNLGRVIVFGGEDPTAVDYFALIGNRLTADDEAACGTALLACANPQTEAFSRGFELLWQSTFTFGRHRINIGEEDSRAFGFVRNPRGSNVIGVTYRDSEDVVESVINQSGSYVTTGLPAAHYGDNVNAYYCFESANGDQRAVLVIDGAQADMLIDPPAVEYDCE